jgi:hypothetical protein
LTFLADRLSFVLPKKRWSHCCARKVASTRPPTLLTYLNYNTDIFNISSRYSGHANSPVPPSCHSHLISPENCPLLLWCSVQVNLCPLKAYVLVFLREKGFSTCYTPMYPLLRSTLRVTYSILLYALTIITSCIRNHYFLADLYLFGR